MQKSQRNTVGDIFWPLMLFLKILGVSPLSYAKVYTIDFQREHSNTEKIYRVVKGQQKLEEEENHVDHPTAENGQQQAINSMIKEDKNEIYVEREYKINYKSLYFVWVLISSIWWSTCWIIILLDSGMAIWTPTFNIYGNVWWHNVRDTFLNFIDQGVEQGSYDPRDGKFMEIFSRIVIAVIATAEIFEIGLSWTEAEPLGRFLNKWKFIEKNFDSTFPPNNGHRPMTHLKRVRNRFVLLYVIIPTIEMYFIFSKLVTYMDTNDGVINKTITVPFTLHSITAILVKDVNVILNYQALADTFLNIRDAMSRSMKLEKLTATKMRGWRTLICQVRDQVVEAGRYQKCHELTQIVLSIVTVTVLTFVVLNGPWMTEGFWVYGVACTCYGLVLLGRIYLKILTAELVTFNEALIARELTDISMLDDYEDDKAELLMEIKFLYDKIAQHPSVISFGDYITLNKSLLLGIIRQVVSYLIALMQFTQSKGP